MTSSNTSFKNEKYNPCRHKTHLQKLPMFAVPVCLSASAPWILEDIFVDSFGKQLRQG